METNFFSRDSEAAFGTQSATMGAGFGPELDWEKLWRDQVFGAKMTETNRNKLVFFLGIQRQPLGPKVRPWEAGFGSESDWEKLWRDQVSGAKMTETNRNSARTCRQQTLSLLDASNTFTGAATYCASSSQHEPAGNRRGHCSMLLEHMHQWNRKLQQHTNPSGGGSQCRGRAP